MGPVMGTEQSDLDVVIIGAGPAGIALAAEARAAGVAAGRILILEKAPEHSWIIRKYYPASKPVLANYKGIEAKCEGVLCIPDPTREETLTFLDQAIGVLGRPNKPSHSIPREVQKNVLFDVTSEEIRGREVLVVGGGDTATEYCQYLVQEGNRVTLSYRGETLTRPNPINRDSLLALERQGRLRILLASNIARLESAGKAVLVRFLEPGLSPLEVDRVVYALGGTTPENFLKSAGIEFDGPEPRLTRSFGTSVPGLFLAGDLTAGRRGGSIILA